MRTPVAGRVYTACLEPPPPFAVSDHVKTKAYSKWWDGCVPCSHTLCRDAAVRMAAAGEGKLLALDIRFAALCSDGTQKRRA